jgi:carbon monoxide dehydrogenase subunit G
MEFENTFVVEAPVEEVWELLLDVERIAPCMPGAQVLEQTGEDAYNVAVKVKLGPMTMNYKGDVEILEKDASAHQATMHAKAKEARGQGTAQASIRMALREQDHGTEASIVTEMQMSGKAAAMGQGVIKDVAATLTDTFAQNLAAMVRAGRPSVGEPEAAPSVSTPSAPPPPPPRPAEPPADAALPASKIIASVVAGRVRDPRTVGVLAVLMLLIGIAIGRKRR